MTEARLMNEIHGKPGEFKRFVIETDPKEKIL